MCILFPTVDVVCWCGVIALGDVELMILLTECDDKKLSSSNVVDWGREPWIKRSLICATGDCVASVCRTACRSVLNTVLYVCC